MKTKFRKRILALAAPVGVLSALSLANCGDGLTLSRTSPVVSAAIPQAAVTPNPYSWVGSQHNAALDFMLRDLARLPEIERMPEAAVLNFVESGTRRFLTANGITPAARSFRDGLASVPRRGAQVRSTQDFVSAGELSIDAAEYLDKIQLWVEDSSISLTDLHARLNSLSGEASGRLSVAEAELVLSVAAVAASSTTYWEENGDAWADQYREQEMIEPLTRQHRHSMSGDDGISILGSIDWRRVAGHDVLGAVSGGVAAAVTGAGIAAGAAGGAACASTISALGQLILGW